MNAEDEALQQPVCADRPLSLVQAWGIYLAVASTSYLCIAFSWWGIFFLVYVIAGFGMTRGVMRRLVEFHPTYHTVASEFSAKIWMFLLWPIHMPLLLLKLSANAIL
jgi:hypothetical protein